jgi:hypothetical protein
MRTFQCCCGNTTYFDNSKCVACGHDLGFCPQCRTLAALEPHGNGYRCLNPGCDAELVKCRNYVEHEVCNRCVVAGDTRHDGYCDCCRFNDTIPDLSVAGNLDKWYRLEAAKRRLFYGLDHLGLPYGAAEDGIQPPLAFDFKADVIPANGVWKNNGAAERVFTGHDNGRITINIREADSAAREKARVQMGEAQRTLIGHFRHEIGHYYWDLLVKGQREAECIKVFGDHNQPTYAEALDTYYKQGAPANWRENFISAYATMHPWEDFAETWGAYLDMASSLDTSEHVDFGGVADPIRADFDAMVVRYQQLGVALNEINRDFGLLDIVPEIFVPAVVEKLRYVHSLVLAGRAENGALAGPSQQQSQLQTATVG